MLEIQKLFATYVTFFSFYTSWQFGDNALGTSFSSLIFPYKWEYNVTDQAFITSNYIYVWSSWMLMCSGTSLSSSESLVTFSFVEDPRLDEKEIGRGTSQEGFWDSGKMLVDWINRTAIVVVTNNREVEKMFLLPLLSSLLVYYTTLKYLINVHNGKPFHLACKEGQFDVVEPTNARLLVSIWMLNV